MADRRAQLQLYRKVLELYGSDEDWAKLAHEQKISTDKEVLETSERAKDMGTPPDVVSEASIAAGKSVADDTLSAENVTRMVEDRMQKLDL
ncbi:hypothetical protein BaRGS_00027019 [Batillaria attramentaria]|uniref:Uncharacterized protein n=1 Tax=Batillaria attramentaria TaxID=370345 RepID=A0ABD0K4L6_9CAEN